MFSGNLEDLSFELHSPIIVHFSGFFDITNTIQGCVLRWFSMRFGICRNIFSKFFVVTIEIMAQQIVICLAYCAYILKSELWDEPILMGLI